MTRSPDVNFSDRDLRNRSFKGQELTGCDFSGSDIRGCDFSGAQLVGSNFARVRAGKSRRQVIILVVFAIAVTVFMTAAVTMVVFATVGLSVAGGDGAVAFILAATASLALAAIGAAIRMVTGTQSLAGVIAGAIAGAGSGAIAGCFLGVLILNVLLISVPIEQVIAGGAFFGAVVMAIAASKAKLGVPVVAMSIAGAAAGIGLAIWLGAIATFVLSRENMVWGIFWIALCLVCVGLSIVCLILAVREIINYPGTFFRKADLTHARFEEAILEKTDFSGAIGYPN